MTPSNLMEWLASIPMHVAAVVIFIPALLVTALGTILVRWLFWRHVAQNSQVVPSKVQFMAEIYSVLLGLMVVAAYSSYGETRTRVLQEVESLRILDEIASRIDSDTSARMQQAVASYARAVVDDEWPRMAFGNASKKAETALTGLFAALPRLEGAGDLSAALAVNQANELIRDVASARLERVSAAPDANISSLLSEVLIVATLLAVSIAWFLRGPSLLVHVIVGGILVATFLSMIIMAIELIYPFAGDIKIDSTAFQGLLT